MENLLTAAKLQCWFTVFESDGPVVFPLEEIEEATGYFDESKIIGEGGYGKVYFGVLGEKVW